MGVGGYFLKYVKATYITRRRSEMRKTIENLKNSIYTYNNYSCLNIMYHMNDELEEEDNTCSHYSVQIDENIQKVLNFINPLNFHNKENLQDGVGSGINEDCHRSFVNDGNKNAATESSISTSSSTKTCGGYSGAVEDSSKYNKSRTDNKKRNSYILKYKINHIVVKRGTREQYRYTYLKSPFKYKYALRHYVFEKYKYHFYFYNITCFNIHIIFNIILSSMTSQTSVKCNINWFFPGNYLFESEFLRKCFHTLIKKNNDNMHSSLNMHIEEQINEICNNLKDKGKMNLSYYGDINLDLKKYNIQNLLPLFFENKIFSENYKNLLLLEEKSFKQMKEKIRKKNVHWFLNKNPNG
ncbi:conserved Plasmodium protein, unknown function [Plasmodium malariae]|uniref:Uncharacterized protein n=1 Tax=Plasmodium malariae TaxID=5858 RepID=A0A1C3KDK3_PLAMA|nr:conserved Plasmodium protein, unknown function [Plasmodium malariae]